VRVHAMLDYSMWAGYCLFCHLFPFDLADIYGRCVKISAQQERVKDFRHDAQGCEDLDDAQGCEGFRRCTRV